jgi:hypothetical protein
MEFAVVAGFYLLLLPGRGPTFDFFNPFLKMSSACSLVTLTRSVISLRKSSRSGVLTLVKGFLDHGNLGSHFVQFIISNEVAAV